MYGRGYRRESMRRNDKRHRHRGLMWAHRLRHDHAEAAERARGKARQARVKLRLGADAALLERGLLLGREREVEAELPANDQESRHAPRSATRKAAHGPVACSNVDSGVRWHAKHVGDHTIPRHPANTRKRTRSEEKDTLRGWRHSLSRVGSVSPVLDVLNGLVLQAKHTRPG